MNFNTNVLKSVVLVSLGALMFAGCSSKESTPVGYNGALIDAPVVGAGWECGANNNTPDGLTLEGGLFGECPAGSTVTFTVGNVVLGTSQVTDDFIFTPEDIAETDDVIAVAQFLQSLDTTDGDTIVITQEVVTAVNSSVATTTETAIADLNVSDDTIDTIVEEIQAEIPATSTVVLESVTEEEAIVELNATNEAIADGTITSPVQPDASTN